MAGLKQADRLMQFSSPLGKDVLLIESLDGAEGVSRLFEYHVELLATVDATIDPKSIVGSKVSIAINLNDAQGSRWISGIVASFEQCAGDMEFDVVQGADCAVHVATHLAQQLPDFSAQDSDGHCEGGHRRIRTLAVGPDGRFLQTA